MTAMTFVQKRMPRARFKEGTISYPDCRPTVDCQLLKCWASAEAQRAEYPKLSRQTATVPAMWSR